MGDSLTPAELVELADRAARGWWIAGHEADDVRQLAALAALEAVDAFRPERGVPLRPFVHGCIRRRLTSAVLEAGRQKRRPLNQSARVFVDGAGELCPIVDVLEDPAADVVERVAGREQLARVRAAMTTLSPLERRSLADHVNGRASRTSSKAADNAIERARRKLRAA